MKTKAETLKALAAHIADECKAVDREAAFDSMIDECYSFEKVGGPFAHMSPSRVLRECDPVAHRCGVNDYADSMEWIEVGGEMYETSEAEEARNGFVAELEDEVSVLEGEIESLESEQEGPRDDQGIAKVQAEMDALRECITAAETVELSTL